EAGTVRRPEDPGQDWPAAWMAAAVRAPERFVPWFEQRLSHAKVSLSGDGVASAKAYLSAQHYWTRGDRLPAAPPSASTRPGRSLESAGNRAARFLLAGRSQDDFWRDFQIVNGLSDEWVTAFVGGALAGRRAGLPDGFLEQAARAVVRRQRPDGGWGYNGQSPADADSTAWVLKFLATIRWAGPEADAGLAFLRSHLRPDGGFATYRAATEIQFGDGSSAIDDQGWRGSHLCVAANAAPLLDGALTGLLVSGQAAEGCWTAYWWRSDAFATAMAVEALPADAHGERRRAVAWARARDASTRSAFDRAWLVRILDHGTPDDRLRARALAHALAGEQREDGGWDASAEMLFPDPSEPVRRSDPLAYPDHRRLFTAAAVLMAIDHLLQTGGAA
ncbi:MAG: prenyltransferase/squalene oxidase repeat-containing protein, partial [Brevundimonas sp.]